MRIDVYTIFPGIFESPLKEGLLGKAVQKGIIEVRVHDIREYAPGKYGQVDDAPFGGGPGMIIKPEPVFEVVTGTLGYEIDQLERLKREVKVILLTPRGKRLDQDEVIDLSRHQHLALICGRYEGVDERIREHLCTDALSVGDYILSGGEVPALVVIESVARLQPGMVGNVESLSDESFSNGLLEYPQYTRPARYLDWGVPEVIVSGNHEQIRKWRREKSLEWTKKVRPDLLGLADREGDRF